MTEYNDYIQDVVKTKKVKSLFDFNHVDYTNNKTGVIDIFVLLSVMLKVCLLVTLTQLYWALSISSKLSLLFYCFLLKTQN